MRSDAVYSTKRRDAGVLYLRALPRPNPDRRGPWFKGGRGCGRGREGLCATRKRLKQAPKQALSESKKACEEALKRRRLLMAGVWANKVGAWLDDRAVL